MAGNSKVTQAEMMKDLLKHASPQEYNIISTVWNCKVSGIRLPDNVLLQYNSILTNYNKKVEKL